MKLRLLLFAALCCTACTNPVAPIEFAGAGIDTLDYVVGDPSMWPRVGNHWQQQTLDRGRQEVCWIKYVNPRTFECWRWNDEWIFHSVDQGIDGDTGESYRFSDGRWLPRHLSKSWSFENKNNFVQWFDRDCRPEPNKSGPAPYNLAVEFRAAEFISIDLGVRDVMVLSYVPNPVQAPHLVEHFYFARGAGWFAWDNSNVSVRFDRIARRTLLTRAKACGE